MTNDPYKPGWISFLREGAPGYAWITLLGGSDLMSRDHFGSPGWTAAGLAVAGVGGVAWQLLKRRDLAERLTLLSCLVVLSVVLNGVLAIINGDSTTASRWAPGVVLAMTGTVAGLVLAERYLRASDRVRKREESEPAGRF